MTSKQATFPDRPAAASRRVYVLDTVALIDLYSRNGPDILAGLVDREKADFVFHPMALAEIATHTNVDYYAARGWDDGRTQRVAKERWRLLLLLIRREPFPHLADVLCNAYVFKGHEHVDFAMHRSSSMNHVAFTHGSPSPAMADHQHIFTALVLARRGASVTLVTRDREMADCARGLGIDVVVPVLSRRTRAQPAFRP